MFTGITAELRRRGRRWRRGRAERCAGAGQVAPFGAGPRHGSPRNAAARHVHNCLGREGSPQMELLEIGRDEVARYGVQVSAGRVDAVRPWELPGTGLVVTTDDGREVSARRLLVATGSPTCCPRCLGWPSGGGATCCTAGTAMAGRSVTVRSPCWPPTRWPRTRRCSSVSSPTTWWWSWPRARHDRPRTTSSDSTPGVFASSPIRQWRRWSRTTHCADSGDELACDAVVVSPGFRPRAEFLAPLGLEPESFEVGGTVLGTLISSGARGGHRSARRLGRRQHR